MTKHDRLRKHVQDLRSSVEKPRTKTKTKKPRATTKAPPAVDPGRAEAAAEVLQAVWLNQEKHFDLESEVVRKDGRPVADQDAEGQIWITVRLHVPRLDVDTWLDGTHLDHPDNQANDDDEDATSPRRPRTW